MQADLNGEPKQAEDGKLWTPGAVDFFRIVNEQITVVEEVTSGEMLLRTGEAVMSIMRDFQVNRLSLCQTVQDDYILGLDADRGNMSSTLSSTEAKGDGQTSLSLGLIVAVERLQGTELLSNSLGLLLTNEPCPHAHIAHFLPPTRIGGVQGG